MFVAIAIAGAATIVALILILGSASRQRDEALRRQAHSYDVMVLARTLSATIARSEASLGRYVISGDRQFGQLYVDGWRLASTEIDRLDQITNDNPEQQPRIDALRAAFQARGRELSLTALSTNYGKNSQALSRYYQARKAASLTQIDRLLDTLISHERARLDQRSAAADHYVERTSRIAGALAIFGLFLVAGGIALGWLTVRSIADRAIARAEADAEHARAEELARAVQVATTELRQQEATLRQVQKMEAVGQLTGGIAHDFNNMLAVVLGGLELAQRHVTRDPREAARHLDSAREGADRAAALVRRLLAFTRAESLKPELFDPAELVAGMSGLLERTLGGSISLVVRDDGHEGCVLADRLGLENTILNLAVNARDAMVDRGTLTIATGDRSLGKQEVEGCEAGDYLTVAVGDTGHGMTPAVVERVFEPFFTTKPVGKGTGLGLSQTFALVRQLGGGITIDTAPGRGTTVTLLLPRHAGASAFPREIEPAAPAPASRDPLSVLVVEDDPRVLAATTGALAELGHAVIACDDPFAAPTLVKRHDFDLLVTDVRMPRQTGPEMVAGLQPRFAHLAVLYVTGFAGEENTETLGRHALLRKPYTLAGLEAAIETALRVERPLAPSRIAAE